MLVMRAEEDEAEEEEVGWSRPDTCPWALNEG